MADKKVTQMTALTATVSPDLLLIIDDPNGTPVGKRVTIKTLFGAIPANTVHNALMKLNANTRIHCSNTLITSNVNMQTSGIFKANNVVITRRSSPSTNNALSEGFKEGQIYFSNTYIYVAVNRTTLKRAALSTF